MGYKNNYKNMGRSNLTFLNASGGANHRDILENIQKELDAELAKISYTDPQGDSKRATAFANAEAKIQAENARWQREETERAKRMDDVFGNIRNVLSSTQTGLTALGIGVNPNANAPIRGQDRQTTETETTEKDYTLWIVGGVVVALGIVGIIVYKARK